MQCDGQLHWRRTLFYWSMLKQGYWLFEFISISSVINQARAKYERSFLLCETDDNDLTDFLLAQVTVIQLALLRHAQRHAGFRYTVLSRQNSHGVSNQTGPQRSAEAGRRRPADPGEGRQARPFPRAR
jgi:Fic family protein